MTIQRTNIRHWHYAYNDWLRALNFYREELGILNERLTEIAGKNTDQEAAVQIEHYQNAFILHRNNINELSHAISESLHKIAKEVAHQIGFVSNSLLDQLEKEKKVFLEEEREINLLRHAFNIFSAEWM